MSERGVSRPRTALALATAIAIGLLEIAGLFFLAFGFLRHPGVEPFDYWREGAVNSVPFGLLGIVLLLKRPENRISWLIGGLSLSGGFQLAAGQYGTLSFRGDLGWPLEVPAMWASTVAQTTLVMFFILIFLYFPTGELVSRAWRAVEIVVGAAFIAQIANVALAPAPLDLAPGVQNPFSVDAGAGVFQTIEVVSAGAIVGLVGAVASLVVRFRRSTGIERQQMKWFVFTAVVGVIVLAASGAVASDSVVGNFLWALIPAAVGVSAAIAILRYRLYDIDLVINRTLVYLSLTGVLALAYLGSVILLQGILGAVTRDSDVAVAASTLAVAALFRPLRARIQSFIDRRFYRSKYDAAETLGRFSSRLRDEVDLDSLSQELVAVVGSTMQPVHAALWLRSSETNGRREERSVVQ